MRLTIIAFLTCLLTIGELSLAFQSPIPLRRVSRAQPKHEFLRRVAQAQTKQQLLKIQHERQHGGSSSPLFGSRRGDGSTNRPNPLKRFTSKIIARLSRVSARFGALPRRAKMILCGQLLFVSLIFGGLTRSSAARKASAPVELPFSQFMDIVENKPGTATQKDELHILDLKIGQDRMGFQLARGDTPGQLKALKDYKKGKNPDIPIPTRAAYTRKVAASAELIDYLRTNDVAFRAETKVSNASVVSLTARGMLMTFYLFYMWKIMKSMGGGGGSSPGKLAKASDLPLATFNDIEGIDDAKFEVMELVDTLRNPDKYAILGARAPKGLLLEGPPGTGKTLLARATAATAGVPLLYCSGSDFVEMFVGRGAARVRKTFEKAEKLAPCLIFIDELDALGKSRDAGMMGGMGRGNDEAEQTLNQLLACMDGLDSKGKQICVMGATNRRQVLDTALLRPGRFDRIVQLTLPDIKGREAILRVHAKKLPGFTEIDRVDPARSGSLGMGAAVDLSAVAIATPGLSGAELEFIVNEAAIRAVRRVSAALRDPTRDPATVTPNVRADDFEGSVKSFYSTRKKGVNGANGSVSEILNTVWK